VSGWLSLGDVQSEYAYSKFKTLTQLVNSPNRTPIVEIESSRSGISFYALQNLFGAWQVSWRTWVSCRNFPRTQGTSTLVLRPSYRDSWLRFLLHRFSTSFNLSLSLAS